MEQSEEDGYDCELHDDLEELFQVHYHKLSIRGLCHVDSIGQNNRINNSVLNVSSHYKHTFCSYDDHMILVWESNNESSSIITKFLYTKSNAIPISTINIDSKAKKTTTTSNNNTKLHLEGKKVAISALTYVASFKLFMVASLDMTFILYDRFLRFIQIIKHNERTIFNLIYNDQREMIISAGIDSISFWRMNRDIGVGTSSYVIERFFHFQQGKKWFDKVIYDEKEHIIFALNDLNVTIFDCTNQKAFATIENAHDAAITKVCWHPHHKVYITGSGLGEIKCWIPLRNHQQFEEIHMKKLHSTSLKFFSLMHTFLCHTKSITGLVPHKEDDLLISASLDGYIRILNLASLTIQYSINTTCSISNLNLIYYGQSLEEYACVFYDTQGKIHAWRMVKLLEPFYQNDAEIYQVELFYNHQRHFDEASEESQEKSKSEQERLRQMRSNEPQEEEDDENFDDESSSSSSHTSHEDSNVDLATTLMLSVRRSTIATARSRFSSAAWSSQRSLLSDTKIITPDNQTETDERNSIVPTLNLRASVVPFQSNDLQSKLAIDSKYAALLSSRRNSAKSLRKTSRAIEREMNTPKASAPVELIDEKYLIIRGHQDFKILNGHSTAVIGQLSASDLVFGVKACTLSVSQQLLFCLMDVDTNSKRNINDQLTSKMRIKQTSQDSKAQTPSSPVTRHKDTSALNTGSNSIPKQNQDTNPVQNDPSSSQVAVQGHMIKVFCLRSSGCPHLRDMTVSTDVDKEKEVKQNELQSSSGTTNLNPSRTKNEDVKATALEIIDILPSVAVSQQLPSLMINKAAASVTSRQRNNRFNGGGGEGVKYGGRLDVRGLAVYHSFDEGLVVGMSNGFAQVLDLFNQGSRCYDFQACKSFVSSMTIRYRARRRELFVLSCDVMSMKYTVTMWSLPSMDCVACFQHLPSISCLGISPTMSAFALGCNDGHTRLYHELRSEYREHEAFCVIHDDKILCLDFCDKLRVYLSCSTDRTIKFWTYEKLILRTIGFQIPLSGALFTGPNLDDVLIIQGKRLNYLKRVVWGDEHHLTTMKASYVDTFIGRGGSNRIGDDNQELKQQQEDFLDLVKAGITDLDQSAESARGSFFLTQTGSNKHQTTNQPTDEKRDPPFLNDSKDDIVRPPSPPQKTVTVPTKIRAITKTELLSRIYLSARDNSKPIPHKQNHIKVDMTRVENIREALSKPKIKFDLSKYEKLYQKIIQEMPQKYNHSHSQPPVHMKSVGDSKNTPSQANDINSNEVPKIPSKPTKISKSSFLGMSPRARILLTDMTTELEQDNIKSNLNLLKQSMKLKKQQSNITVESSASQKITLNCQVPTDYKQNRLKYSSRLDYKEQLSHQLL